MCLRRGIAAPIAVLPSWGAKAPAFAGETNYIMGVWGLRPQPPEAQIEPPEARNLGSDDHD